MLPNFIIVGASRSGTSTLWSYLKEHPQIYLPEQKELRFFEQDELYLQGQQFYEAFFSRGKHKIRGEASPPYFHEGITKDINQQHRFDINDDAAVRIQKMIPDVKIIITLRSPITRLYSQFIKNLRQGKEENYQLEEALEAELSGRRTHLNDGTSWIYKNSYSIHLAKWMKLFPKENILILIFEDWKNNPDNALKKITEFLGISTEFKISKILTVKNKNREPRLIWLHKIQQKYLGKSLPGKIVYRLNQKESTSRLSEEQFNYLKKIFDADICKVEKILNRDLTLWRTL